MHTNKSNHLQSSCEAKGIKPDRCPCHTGDPMRINCGRDRRRVRRMRFVVARKINLYIGRLRLTTVECLQLLSEWYPVFLRPPALGQLRVG